MTHSLSHEAMAEQWRVAQLPYAPAELHGLLCGALAATPALTEAALYARLANHVGEERWPAAWVSDWRQLRDQVLAAYQAETEQLTLLLPLAPLVERVAALAVWCEGFMAGFAEGIGKRALPDVVTDARMTWWPSARWRNRKVMARWNRNSSPRSKIIAV